jgi:hypothetical protein
MAVRSHRRRKPKGGYTTVRSFSRKQRKRANKQSGRKRVRRMRKARATGTQLKAGWKFGAKGQVIRDRKKGRVKRRRKTQSGARRVGRSRKRRKTRQRFRT